MSYLTVTNVEAFTNRQNIFYHFSEIGFPCKSLAAKGFDKKATHQCFTTINSKNAEMQA